MIVFIDKYLILCFSYSYANRNQNSPDTSPDSVPFEQLPQIETGMQFIHGNEGFGILQLPQRIDGYRF